MLTLTDKAAEAIRVLTSQPGMPSNAGLRLTQGDSEPGALALSLEEPQPQDAVVETSGARIFVEHEAADLVEDRELDARLDEEGRVSFTLGSQAGG